MEWWNDGTMEYWGESREVSLFLIMDSKIYPKMAQFRQPIFPTLHYSIFPVRLLPAAPTASDARNAGQAWPIEDPAVRGRTRFSMLKKEGLALLAKPLQ